MTPQRAMRSTVVALLGALATLLLAPGTAPPVAAQGAGAPRVHVALSDGPWKGEHDAVLDELCHADIVGPGTWEIAGFSDPPLEFVSVVVAPGQDQLGLTFDDPNAGEAYYSSVAITWQVDDRGTSATVSGVGEVVEMFSDSRIGVEITVECPSVDPPGRPAAGPATEPTPLVLGSPPPGATAFHVEVGSGPHAGTYDVWTREPSCRRAEDGSWMATYQHPETTLGTVVLVMAPDEFDGALIGLVEVGFHTGSGIDAYSDREPLVGIGGDGPSATLAVTAQATARSWSDDDPQPVVELALTISCPMAGR